VYSAKKNLKNIKKSKNFLDILVSKISHIRKQKKIKKIRLNKNLIKKSSINKRYIHLQSKKRLPSLRQIKYFSKVLDERESIILKTSLFVFLISSLVLIFNFYRSHLQLVPISGGEYIEGLVGSPKYLNPVYASAKDTDHDISRLVFSSLFRRDSMGALVNDLVTGYEISEDGKVYTISIREDAKWHVSENLTNQYLTSDDVIFTFNVIRDPKYNSPLRENFLGVEIEKVNHTTFKFVLLEPYAPFLDMLTFGVLPQELWSQIPPESANLAELNLSPIGTGPYKAKTLKKDKEGDIKKYTLLRNEEYYGAKPYIENIVFRFFPNFTEAIIALNENTINGLSYLPSGMQEEVIAQNSLHLHKLRLPQINTVFLNSENNPSLADLKMRQALAYGINRDVIRSEVFNNEVELIDSPILPDSFAYNNEVQKYNFDIDLANSLLDELGWERREITEEDMKKAEAVQNASSTTAEELTAANELILMEPGLRRIKKGKYLTIVLTTVETEDNLRVVEYIKNYWEQIGVRTFLNIIPVAKMQYDVIKSSNFEALFYGQVVGSDPDSYVFWHSSQIGEGLNITNYENKTVDKLLEEARVLSDPEARRAKYFEFQKILTEEVPAIFMHSSIYTYVQSKKIKAFNVSNIMSPADRFSNITDWYIKTDKKLIFN